MERWEFAQKQSLPYAAKVQHAIRRFCCTELKEKQIPELRYATHAFGVRKAESTSRAAKRDSIELRNRIRANTETDFYMGKKEEK